MRTWRAPRFLVLAHLVSIWSLLACPSSSPPPEEPPPPPITQPEPPPPPPAPKAEGFQVSQEVYNDTFNKIEDLILKLNRIIQNGQFSVWREYLTPEYIQKFSDPAYLREISQNPVLQRRGIRLTNLRHYFDEVVVASRANARLDKIEFIDNNRVVAYMELMGEMSILYQLINIDGEWKITIW